MLLDAYRDFFITCVGASASFIGLLFVALSVILDNEQARLEILDRRRAENAFIAFANIFFVSFVTLIPGNATSFVAILSGIISLYILYRLFTAENYIRLAGSSIIWLIATIIIYLTEIIFAALMLADPANTLDITMLSAVIMVLFATGLLRAWELTGIHRR